MIEVTRLNNKKLMINALLIESIESTPDTVITLTTGKKWIVLESIHTVNELIIQFMKEIGAINCNIHMNQKGGSKDV
ncbi:flagellar FlbD family protein [Longirhabdus pacifica]|uniref:flagellar FlbD family protein n=1 Tax=Longirhabdus pacifica TaxID=2305227 RepID=UPI001008EF4F|nr:flagellar FlbD family protein [Longirhabdus pacifica]